MELKKAIGGYNPLKNIRQRLRFLLPAVISIILMDEYIKEDYLFELTDTLKLGTHENIIMLLVALLGVSEILGKTNLLGLRKETPESSNNTDE